MPSSEGLGWLRRLVGTIWNSDKRSTELLRSSASTVDTPHRHQVKLTSDRVSAPSAPKAEHSGDDFDREAGAWMKAILGAHTFPECLAEQRPRIEAILTKQLADARRRLSDNYWSSLDDYGRRHNVGQDVLIAFADALQELLRVGSVGGADASIEIGQAVRNLTEAIRTSGKDLKVLSPDPDGYGSATTGEIVRDLEQLVEELGGPPSASMLEPVPDTLASLMDAEESRLRFAREALERLEIGLGIGAAFLVNGYAQRTLRTVRRLLAPEIQGIATLDVPSAAERLAMAHYRLSGGGQELSAESRLFNRLEALLPPPPHFDPEEIQSRASYTTAVLLARIPEPGEEGSTERLEGLWKSALEAASDILYRAFRAEQHLSDKVLCPMSLYVFYVLRHFADNTEALQRAYWCLLTLRDGLVFDSPDRLVERIKTLESDTLYLEYFTVMDDLRRVLTDRVNAAYVAISFRGGDPSGLRIKHCLSDKGENDREIADFRGHLTGHKEVEPRALGLAAVMNITFAALGESWTDHDFETQKGMRVAMSLLAGLGIEDAPGGPRRIVVRPVGDIARVPIEVLPFPGGTAPIGDVLAVHYANQPVVLDRSDTHLARPTRALVLGGCDFDEAPDSSGRLRCIDRAELFQSLPGTREEATQVAWLLGVDQLPKGGLADVEAALASNPQVVHLATHSFFVDRQRHRSDEVGQFGTTDMLPRPRFGLDGAVVLSGANSHVDDFAWVHADCVASLERIACWDLAETQIVTLSACESGLGTIEIEAGGTGLREAFLSAGARCVISSLWPVEDEGTAIFVERFYRGMTEGMRVSDALLNARRASVSDVGRDRHAFVSIGADIRWS